MDVRGFGDVSSAIGFLVDLRQHAESEDVCLMAGYDVEAFMHFGDNLGGGLQFRVNKSKL